MANTYIPGFTPSLYGKPVKRMAIGGRMEGNRAFRERDDTIDYEAVGNPLGNLQNTLSNIDANSVMANFNNAAAPQMPTEMPQMPETPTEPVRKQVISDYNPYNIGNYGAQSYAEPSYQSQPTPQPVQTAPYYGDYNYDPYGIGNLDLSSYQLPQMPTEMPQMPQPPTEPLQKWVDPYYGDYNYDPYGIGNFGLPSYQQSGPTAAQLAARDQELTKPGVTGAEWDPLSSSFMFDKAPTPTKQSTGPYYVDPGEFDPVYNPYNIGNFGLSSYQQSGPTAAQLAARDLELTKPGVTGAQWDPLSNSFMYDKAPVPTAQPTGPYYVDPGEFDPVYNPYNIGNFGLSAYNTPALSSTSTLFPGTTSSDFSGILNKTLAKASEQGLTQAGAQMGALPATQPGATSAAISANSPPPGTTWGVYSNPNDPTSQYTVNFMNSKKGAMPLTVSADTPVFLYDNKTKQVLASGIGKEGADAVAAAVYKLNNDPKGSSYWDIYTGPPGATDSSQFRAVVSDAQDKNFGQRFLSAMGTILPIAVQFIPGLGQASLAAKIAAGAAAGGAGAALKGQDILRGAVLGGATSGVFNAPILNGGKTLSGVVGSAVGNVPIVGDALRKVSNLTGGGSSATPGEIVVRAGTAKPLVDAAAASLLGSGAFLPDYSGLSKFADPSYTGGSDGGGGYSGSTGALEDVGNFITVAGKRIPTSNFTNAVNAASGALSGINYGDQIWERPAAQDAAVREPGSNEYDPANQEIVVKSGKYKVPFDAGSTLNKFLNADYMGTPDYTGYEDLIDKYNNMYDIEYPYDDEGWTVEGAKKLPRVIPPTAALPDLFDPLNSVDIPTDLVKDWPDFAPEDQENEIVVKGKKPVDLTPPAIIPGGTPPTKTTDTKTDDKKDDDKKDDDKKDDDKKDDDKKIIDDILKVISTVGPLFATTGSSSGGSSAYSGMRGPLNPIFSAKLPKPNMQMAMPRALNFDAYRYGYGPEQSFFTNVPQGALNTSTAYTGYGVSPRYNATEQYASDFAALVEKMKKQREQDELEAAAAALGLTGYATGGYATGGYAVGGAGDGREDKIPAMLSDGEYVMDAETVAMLGNGSSKAGADLLDKFRVNIRKHKGRELAKGKFSANAKKPEQYLKGRK